MRTAILALVLSTTAWSVGNAQVITQWTFPTIQAAPYNSPPTSTGSGTAKSLGMDNNYNYAGTTATNSVTMDDITSSPGVANPNFVENTWRIRGAYVATGTAPNIGSPSNSKNVNGWNLSAPQYTQGAEFDVDTTGFASIKVTFDWYATTQGIRDLQEQYSLDGTNWININPLQVAVPNDFDGTSSPTNTIDLSAIAGASNDPKFGIRLVSAYDPTFNNEGAASTTYTSASLTNGQSTAYNNSSGNWRFGDVTFSGTSVIPEPGTYALMVLAILLLVGHKIWRRGEPTNA